MSRAFVKEDDQSRAGDELPERSQSPHPNYVTAEGLADLKRDLEALIVQREAAMRGNDALAAEESLRRIDRNLRYVKSRVACAIRVDPADQPRDEVAFGARVRVRDPDGEERVFSIVGEDEADHKEGKISVMSPIARSVIGKSVGDAVVVRAPGGDVEYEIDSVDYPRG